MKIIRVQLDLPEDRVIELEELMRQARIATRKELFNNALTLFEWAVSERKKGKAIGSIDGKEKTFQQLLMPAVQSVKPQAEEEESFHATTAASFG